MNRKKTIHKVKEILGEYSLNKILTYLSFLSTDQAYNWVLYLLRINKSYEIDTMDWDTLIEIYKDKVRVIEKEIKRFRSVKNEDTIENDLHSFDASINQDSISITIEDIYLHSVLRNLRNEDDYQEEVKLVKNNPNTSNQYIAHLKSLLRYYQRRLKEMEAFLEFSDQSQGITSKILNELHYALPLSKQSKLKQKPRGAGKIKPSFELTNELIEQCLADEYYYDKNDRPVRYRIKQSVLSQLEKKFRNEETPGFTENLTESGVDYRVKKYLKEH